MSRVDKIPSGQGGLFIANDCPQNNASSGYSGPQKEKVLADALLSLDTILSARWESLSGYRNYASI